MSSGSRIAVQYQMRAVGGNTGRRCLVLLQPETLTLRLNGLTNTPPSTVTTVGVNFYATYLPVAKSVSARTATARAVRLRWIVPPPGQVGNGQPLVCVPSVGTFDTYQVGQTGTYNGGQVECVSKHEFGI